MPPTFEFALNRLDPLYHLWRAATFHVARVAGAALVREWDGGDRRLVYLAFSVCLSQSAIMDAMTDLVSGSDPFDPNLRWPRRIGPKGDS